MLSVSRDATNTFARFNRKYIDFPSQSILRDINTGRVVRLYGRWKRTFFNQCFGNKKNRLTTINVTFAVFDSRFLGVFMPTAFYRFYQPPSADRKRSKTPFSPPPLTPDTQSVG